MGLEIAKERDDGASAADVALALAAKSGDARAFEALYERYMSRIYRYCLVRLGTREDAEDATSAVFASLVRGLGRYEDRGLPFAAYLFRIARNAVVDQLRRRRLCLPLEEAEERPAHDAEPDPLALSDRLELLTALRELPDLHREVVVLRFVEGYEASEVAKMLGKSETAVRSIQHRAVERLRGLLRPARLAEMAPVR